MVKKPSLSKEGKGSMLKKIKSFLTRESAEGVLTGILWMAVVAIVSGAISYSIWAAVSSSATSLKGLITTTIH